MTAEAAAGKVPPGHGCRAALAVLKPAQREKWNALLGKPFRLSQR